MNHIQNELYSWFTGEYKEGETELDLLSRSAFAHIIRKKNMQMIQKNGYPPLSKEELRQIREYYKGYPDVNPIYHQVYKGKSGKFYPEYISDELYYKYIEPYFSGIVETRYVDNKCDYYRMFSGIKQPELVCMRTRRLWSGSDGHPITKKEVLKLLKADGEMVLKLAENSEGGAGVHFLPEDGREEQFRELIKSIPCDVVIQKALRQHESYAVLHPQSVNTLRIMSLLEPDGVHILSTCIRIGVGENRLDNQCSGGFFVGVKENGELREFGIFGDGTTVKEHPDLKYMLAEQRIPYLDRAFALVKEAHLHIPRFRLVSWDIALDEMGEANLIEVNLTLGVISDMQACNGPLFGNQTQKILQEVFKK